MPNLGSEMWKIKIQKILGNLLDELRKLYMNGTVIYKICFSEQIFYRKQSLGAPCEQKILVLDFILSVEVRAE